MSIYKYLKDTAHNYIQKPVKRQAKPAILSQLFSKISIFHVFHSKMVFFHIMLKIIHTVWITVWITPV